MKLAICVKHATSITEKRNIYKPSPVKDGWQKFPHCHLIFGPESRTFTWSRGTDYHKGATKLLKQYIIANYMINGKVNAYYDHKILVF